MDVSNDTPYDAKYKVSGGGTPMDPPGRFVLTEETARWEVIAAGTAVKVPTTSKGPWRVYFAINGEGHFAVSTADNDKVHLIPAEKSFRTMIQKVSHSTGRVVVPANLAKSA